MSLFSVFFLLVAPTVFLVKSDRRIRMNQVAQEIAEREPTVLDPRVATPARVSKVEARAPQAVPVEVHHQNPVRAAAVQLVLLLPDHPAVVRLAVRL